MMLVLGCGPGEEQKPATTTTGATAGSTGTTATSEPEFLKELEKTDIKVGKGPSAESGDFVLVKYEGRFKNGERFDNSGPGGFAVTIDESPVIEGWHKGLVGMKEGGVREIGVPWSMAYGEMGQGQIPPKTDLYFEITLLGLVKKGQEMVIVPTEVKAGSGRPVGEGDAVTIHATTHLVDGTPVFDTRTNNQPQTFTIGEGKAYAHVEEGVKGMRPGGVRKLRVPPEAAFGKVGQGMTIPPNAILLYEIELISAKYK